jgi:hypothetical protein
MIESVMVRMTLWWREHRRPALKCARVGHRQGIERREGWRRPRFDNGEHRAYVAMQVREERETCLRCQAPLGDWTETYRHGFTGYSWPADQDEAFQRDGEYWTRLFSPRALLPDA